MPTDNNGVYSLPSGYLAVTGETIAASQHNPPLEDLAAAMSGRLPRNGSAPMTAPLKAYNGTAAAPGMAFASGLTSGVYLRSDGGLGLSSAGAVVGTVCVGSGMDFWGTTAPAGWLFPYGQAVSRTTYAALFAVLGTAHGAGDGSTTFNLPDKRDRASFGKGNMGGTAADRITNQTGGWEGDTIGSAGGSQSSTLTQANLPAVTLTTSIASGQGSHAHGPGLGELMAILGTTSGSSAWATGGGSGTAAYAGSTALATLPAMTGTTPLGGSGTALNNLPPGIVCNYIIFTGVF